MNYNYLSGSNGSGKAVLAHIQSNRSIGSTVINVDSLSNWPASYIVTTGKLLTSGFLDPNTITEMRAHTSAGTIVIDQFLPGSTDIGNTNDQVAMIKPSTSWADSMVANAQVSHNDDGTIKNDAISAVSMFADAVDPALRSSEQGGNFIASGGIWTADAPGSTRAASMTAAVVYVNGNRLTINAITARSFTASKDTYIDVLLSGTTGTLVYTEVANNAASPTLAANSVRLGIVVTGATSIAAGAINQAQNTATVPVVAGITLGVGDSLGNLIYPTSPVAKNSIGAAQVKGIKLFGAAALGGSNTPAVATGQFLMQAGSIVVGTGYNPVTYPTAFPNGVVTLIVANGDGNANNGTILTRTITTTGFETGSTLSGSVRVNWLAIGW